MFEYAVKKDALQVELYRGITYKNYILALEESQKTNLSRELFEKIKNERLTKSNIASMQKSLEMQFEDLQKMKAFFH